MLATMRLRSLLLLNVLLLLPLANSGNGAIQRNAEEVKNQVCPKCYRMEDGMIQEFYVVRQVNKNDILVRTHINGERSPDTELYTKGDYYDLRYIPVFKNGDFERIMVEINDFGHFKRIQVKQSDGSYQYDDVGHSSKVQRQEKQFCHVFQRFTIHHQTAFSYVNYFFNSKSEAFNLFKVCNDNFGPEDPQEVLNNLPAELVNGRNREFIKECFEYTDKTCVYNVDNPSYLSVFKGKRERIAYMRNDLIVYIGCGKEKDRCIYIIHDTVTGLDWWIPDEIEVHPQKLNGEMRSIVPLLRLDDPFLTSELRYKYAPSSTTIKTKPIITTTTTVKPITRPGQKTPDEGDGDEKAVSEGQDAGEGEEGAEGGDEDLEFKKEESSSSQYEVITWIVALMLFMCWY
ncbi:unnamed protein product [Bursaphelenchus okinawaensis]|uniref:Uncharacterized protein n=1 Tax=Bursaphelenchus okinawaensis TaxID=465554 RepID=A0A811JV70_9BILA|nr:unnamed protein product [Bursaphelenchus okinawaensis]CAG9084799.1 unnamed protein product [Bursaphelenchus okinawaensis]